MQACLGADVMMGNDPNCANWIRKYRDMPAPSASGAPGAAGAEGAGRGRREGGHRRRA
jgi:5-methyltetrahydrofolate--homocysteine methyltransferase